MRFLPLALLAMLIAGPGTARGQDFNVSTVGISAYDINGVNNPTLPLVRGRTYLFSIDAIGHPFWIKTSPTIGTGNAFNTGVSANGVQSGEITWTVPASAPSTLYYNCQFHSPMSGIFTITSPPTPFVGPVASTLLGLGIFAAGALRLRRRT